MNTDLNKEILIIIQHSLREAIKTKLTGYNSPLDKYIADVVSEHQDSLKGIMREALGSVVASPEFRASVKDAFIHKLGRTLVDQLDGSVKQAAEKLRNDPTIKAQMVLAIQNIVDSALAK